MPSVTAERLCPQAIWLPARMSLYADVSREIRRLFEAFTPAVEPVSIDEAFLDLGGIAHELADGERIARDLKQRIRDEQRLTASVGIAPNKFLAKVASDLDKPDGLVMLGHDQLADLLWPLPIDRLWGVGPKTAERLRQRRITRIGDLARVQQAVLRGIVGAHSARHLHALAHGRDDRPVESQRDAKSISEERTYTRDLVEADAIDRALLQRAEGVARELRRQRVAARTVHLKVRGGDFSTWTRSWTLPEPTDLAEVLVEAARRLFAERIELGTQGVRLLGIGVSGLEAAQPGQPELFPDRRQERIRRAARTADAIRERLGPEALVRARLLKPRDPAEDSP